MMTDDETTNPHLAPGSARPSPGPAPRPSPSPRPQAPPRPSSATPAKRGRPAKPKVTELDPEALKHGQAEAEAQAQRVAEERKRLLEEAAQTEKAHETAEKARKPEQRELAKVAGRQTARIRKRLGGRGAELLEELEGTEHGQKPWGQLQGHLKAASRIDALFAELRRLEAVREALKSY